MSATKKYNRKYMLKQRRENTLPSVTTGKRFICTQRNIIRLLEGLRTDSDAE